MSCYVMNIFDFAGNFSRVVEAPVPLTFEKMSHPYGFLLYSTEVHFQPSDPAVLRVEGLNDRAIVFVNKVYAGILSREQGIRQIPLQVSRGT